MHRSRDSLRKWHLTRDLNGRKEWTPSKHKGRVFLAVNLLGLRSPRGNRPSMFSRRDGQAQNKDSHIPSTSFPHGYSAFKDLILNPPTPPTVCLLSHSAVSNSCDPMDCSLPGSSVHRIFQARILEWVAVPSPGDLPNPGIKPRSPAWQADSFPESEPPGKPNFKPYLSHILRSGEERIEKKTQ